MSYADDPQTVCFVHWSITNETRQNCGYVGLHYREWRHRERHEIRKLRARYEGRKCIAFDYFQTYLIISRHIWLFPDISGCMTQQTWILADIFNNIYLITYSNIFLVYALKMCNFSEYFGHLFFDFNAKFRVIFSHFFVIIPQNAIMVS